MSMGAVEAVVVVIVWPGVGFTTTSAISAYHHQSCEFESRSWRRVLDAALCNKVSQLQVVVFLRILRFPQPIKLTATI